MQEGSRSCLWRVAAVTQKSTHSSFFSRVEFEREILRLANQLPGVTEQLDGLHPNTRDRWISVLPRTLRESDVPNVLQTCWEELGCMADQSRNVFEVRPAKLQLQEQLVSILKSHLVRNTSEHCTL